MKTLCSLLVSALLTLAAAATARAQTVAPVPAPTIIKTAPYTISKPGFYQLGADLTYAGNGGVPNDAIITIAASNVTLDFAGHYLSGPSGAPATKLYGVYANEAGNLTIRNGTVAYCFAGICLTGNGKSNSLNINQNVRDMLLSYCYFAGALHIAASNSLFSNNRVSFIGGSTVPSITFTESDGSSKTFDGSGVAIGVDFTYGAGNTVADNTITNLVATDTNFGVEDGTNAVFVSGNRISTLAGAGYGIFACDLAVNNNISGCTYGIFYPHKYANNLTSNCQYPFTADNGTAAGYNN